jgi:acyl-CoA reductase-like NAD-dependent aldehyde dehydrogenase
VRKLQDVMNPADLSSVGRSRYAARADRRCAERCRRGAEGLGGAGREKRAAALHRVADSMESGAQGQVAELMTREMGKPYSEAVGELMNVGRSSATMRRSRATMAVSWPADRAGVAAICEILPYGVSVHIMPYNFRSC